MSAPCFVLYMPVQKGNIQVHIFPSYLGNCAILCNSQYKNDKSINKTRTILSIYLHKSFIFKTLQRQNQTTNFAGGQYAFVRLCEKVRSKTFEKFGVQNQKTSE